MGLIGGLLPTFLADPQDIIGECEIIRISMMINKHYVLLKGVE